MPELPEVETIARTLAPQVLGKTVRKLEILLPRALQDEDGLAAALDGARINAVRRRAKLLLMDCAEANGAPLLAAMHFKMTGKVFVYPDGTPSGKHTRLILDLTDSSGKKERLFFDDMRTFGYLRLMRPRDLERWPFWQKLGLEPLEHQPEELGARLAERMRNGRAGLKGLLLDQTIICGIGNIYADEALFRAGIRPDASTVSAERLTDLAREVQAVLQESIEACGSSIRDYRDAEGNAGAFQNQFKAYGRGGQPCTLCGTTMTATRVAGRGTAFCPQCQR